MAWLDGAATLHISEDIFQVCIGNTVGQSLVCDWISARLDRINYITRNISQTGRSLISARLQISSNVFLALAAQKREARRAVLDINLTVAGPGALGLVGPLAVAVLLRLYVFDGTKCLIVVD